MILPITVPVAVDGTPLRSIKRTRLMWKCFQVIPATYSLKLFISKSLGGFSGWHDYRV